MIVLVISSTAAATSLACDDCSCEAAASCSVEVLISSARRMALMHEHRGAPEPTLDELLDRLAPVDLVPVEGFKHGDHERLEVYRRGRGGGLLARDDPGIIAVASDAALPGLAVPCLALDDTDAIADFVLARYWPESRVA